MVNDIVSSSFKTNCRSSDTNYTPSIFHRSVETQSPKTINWNTRLINQLDQFDALISHKIPNFAIQNRIDSLGNYLKNTFSPLNGFNEWLSSNGEGDWYLCFATFLAKLPLRAARNILYLLYNLIKTTCFAINHPIRALNALVKQIILLLGELSKPEVWSKVGAGMIGASLGHSLTSGQPLSLLGIAIGAL